ncbi:MAG TPA: hypothetical protein ENN68_01385 [Methanomicrobia archaeon]|nr:hypothetical protein [Methanomicrobia archaeon]
MELLAEQPMHFDALSSALDEKRGLVAYHLMALQERVFVKNESGIFLLLEPEQRGTALKVYTAGKNRRGLCQSQQNYACGGACLLGLSSPPCLGFTIGCSASRATLRERGFVTSKYEPVGTAELEWGKRSIGTYTATRK